MRQRAAIVVALGLLAALLAALLLGRRQRPAVPGSTPQAAPARSASSAPPTATTEAEIERGVEPVTDAEPEQPAGPSNLPPGTAPVYETEGGLMLPGAVELEVQAYRDCYQRYVKLDPELPPTGLLEFTIESETVDTGGTIGQVREVQLRLGQQDYELGEHQEFELCAYEAVQEMIFLPPAGGGSIRVGITVDLAAAD